MPLDRFRKLGTLLPAASARLLNQALNETKAELCGKVIALNDEFYVRLSGSENESLDKSNRLFNSAFHYSDNGRSVAITYCSKNMLFQITFANGSEW